MNRIHEAIIAYIREQSPDDAVFTSLNDDLMIGQMFYNYRGGRGLRLSNFGSRVMPRYFKSYTIKVPNGEGTHPLHLIFLDGHARLPYYCGVDEIVVYDHVLGVKLCLVDGRLSILMEMEIET
jgi:hypothetical protein